MPRARAPFLGLFAAAIAGILLANHVLLPGWAFFVAFLGAALLAVFQRPWIWPAAALAFASIHVWQTRESPAAHLAADLSADWQIASVVFTALTPPETASRDRSKCDVRIDHLEIAGRTLPDGATALLTGPIGAFHYGDHIEVTASVRNIPPTANPGAFDFAGWLMNRHILSEVSLAGQSVPKILGSAPNPIIQWAAAARIWIESSLSRDIQNTREAAVIRGMTTGDTDGIPQKLEDAFRETGVYHLFSVSGLHVGIVGALIWLGLGMFGISPRRAVAIVIPLLFFYALITGWKPASIRAATMLSLIAAGLVFDRKPIPLNSVGAAGFLILLFDTNQLFNPGFQLSFTVVGAILLFARPITRWLKERTSGDPFLPRELRSPLQRFTLLTGQYTGALAAVSIAAWIGSLPLTIYYFNLVSFSAIPTNMIAVPAAFLVLSLAAVSVAAGAFIPWMGAVFNNANFLVTHLLLTVIGAFADVPGSYVRIHRPPPADVIGEMTVFEAGAGSAISIRSGGRTWLVDAGSEFFGRNTVLPYLKAVCAGKLDGAVLTHGDSMHVGGFRPILDAFPAIQVYDTGVRDRSRVRSALLDQLLDAGHFPAPLNTGGEFFIPPDTSIEVLYPPPEHIRIYADDKAAVLRVRIGSLRILLLSDSGYMTESRLLEHAAADLPCDILIKGQHISGQSGDEHFIQTASPKIIIASDAPFPPKEQLPRPWKKRLEARGIRVMALSQTGAVQIYVRRNSAELLPYLGGAPVTIPLPATE